MQPAPNQTSPEGKYFAFEENDSHLLKPNVIKSLIFAFRADWAGDNAYSYFNLFKLPD